ncbi:MAG: hypothetical protein GC131_04175 [Alphaproteobacteria bacterium]|nr:hypothetical protein [Alphaproteobacteria bacterium]
MSAEHKHTIDLPVALFSLTLLLSATLMFAVQPMIGKMLLPLVGGAPAGWLVAMAFFQTVLLIGYAVAALATRLPPAIHGIGVIVLLGLGLFVLPVSLNEAALGISRSHFIGVALALAATIFLPFMALSTISTSMQRQFTLAGTNSARDPYFLFAASNFGSFLGLLSYPFWVEPALPLQQQVTIWYWLYIGLIGLCALCVAYVMMRGKGATQAAQEKAVSPAPSWKMRLRWLMLAFIPAALSLGLTSLITTDTGSIPFFWVLPLALYLLTFVAAFAGVPKNILGYANLLHLFATAMCVSAVIIKNSIVGAAGGLLGLVMPVLAFCAAALIFHARLAAERPGSDRLGEYYFWLSLGGALGGIFGALIAPQIFVLPIEFSFVLLLSLLLNPFYHRDSKIGLTGKIVTVALMLAALGATGVILVNTKEFYALNFLARPILIMSLIALAFLPKLIVPLGFFLFTASVAVPFVQMEHIDRNFYGVIKVYETERDHGTVRVLNHGTTTHGWQKVKPEVDLVPRAYYDPQGPLGDLFKADPMKVGVVGLGAGATICYDKPGRSFTVYEIDQAIVDTADKYFEYMRGCGKPRIVIGDGRKELEKDTDARYDLLILDAFSSDAIPLHLMTREAAKIYLSRLAPGGRLAFHVSNRFYSLQPALAVLAADLGVPVLRKDYVPSPGNVLATPSEWVVFGTDKDALKGLRGLGWVDLLVPKQAVWTDDYSNILSALRYQ